MSATNASIIDAAEFHGRLIHPGDATYDESRSVFNALIDRSPAVIARCHDVSDVVTAVRAARAKELPLSVYGGGHGVTGSAVIDAGICIDMRDLDAISVNAAEQTAVVGAGCTWGQVDAATQEHGLAVTGGRVSSTGVAGLTLGSGSGWLERKLGFTCDNLLSVQVVTADARVVTASETENADLFWALRGGGGNFGIATEFTFRVSPIGPIVLGGLLLYPAAMATDVVRHWRDFMMDAPDEVGSGLAFITAPPADFVPEPARGKPVIGIIICYAGDIEAGQKVLAPLLEFGPPAVNMVQPMPYVAVQQMIDHGNEKGANNYWSGDFIAELPDKAVDALIDVATVPVSPMTQVILVRGGGAIARVAEDDTAFGQRDAAWNIHYLSMWTDDADTDKNIAYTRELVASLKPWTTGRLYLNFIGDEGPGRVAAAFGPEKFEKLQQLKAKWDPDNLFRNNQNIPPAT
ncbi:MAG TPA: FAD-binding oxidoreductase [Actinomycetes bacterium]|nr:FAD-binding oxidoreductase [Actinomycetes bacterium]